jgi:hypothetical protein
MSVVPALRRRRQEDLGFKASLIVRPYHKINFENRVSSLFF